MAKAADAAKDVINWAPSANCFLIADKGIYENYRYVWEMPDNEEIILSSKLNGVMGIGAWLLNRLIIFI